MNRLPIRGAFLVLLMIPLLASGGSFIVPPDRDLILESEIVAVVTIQSQQSYRDPSGLILTDFFATVDDVPKGEAGQGETIVITEIGGVVDDVGLASSTSPRYVVGQRALVFLERYGDDWTTHSGLLGKFDFVRDVSFSTFLVRGSSDEEIFGWNAAGREHVEKSRDAEAFLQYIRNIARGDEPKADYFEDMASDPIRETTGNEEGWVTSSSTFTGNAFMMQFGFDPPGGSRWSTGAFTFKTFSSQTGSAAAITNGPGAWNVDPTSDIAISVSGTVGAINYGDSGGDNVNVLNFGVAESFTTNVGGVSSTPLAGSVVGQALLWASSATHTNLSGESFYTSTECDIVIQDPLTSTIVDEVVAHEIGHCLGFRHSNNGTAPSTTLALMNSTVSERGSSLLADWDREAANEVYGDGSCSPTCTLAVPTNLIATASSSTAVLVSWTASAGASTYQIHRSSDGVSFGQVGTTGSTAFSDTTASANTAYLYKVRAVDASANTSGFSNVDVATTVMFTDPSIAAGTTIKAAHFTELRTAVNAMLTLAPHLSTVSFTDSTLDSTVPVKAAHLTELRTNLAAARSDLVLSAIGVTDDSPAGVAIKAVHIQELRSGVQ